MCKEKEIKADLGEVRVCSVPGCSGRVVARGFCSKHYKQWSRKGEVSTKERREVCKVPGCSEACHGRGFCRMHYNQFRRGRLDEEGNQLIPKGMRVKF